jgi:DNA primase catalytic core
MADRFSEQYLEELRAKLPVSELVGKKVKLKKKGHEFVGLSPFNQEKTPSFFVNDDKEMWFDFSSGQNGNIFDFMMHTEGCEFPEAVERCAALAGLQLPARVNGAAPDAGRRLALIEIVELAAAFYEAALLEPGSAAGRDYLAGRGVSAKAIERFRIGFAPDARFALKEHLGARGIRVEDMIAAGLLIHGDDIPVPYDRFRDRVMFPITDMKGRVIAFGGRAIDATTSPKYLNSPDSDLFHKGQVLYNAAAARPAVHKGSQLIVVEGYLDVVSMVMASFEGTVAPLGTALTAEQLAMLWRLSPEPCLCFDGDAAGRRAASRAVDLALPLISAERRLRFVELPEGQDPDELARARGPAGTARVMSSWLPLSEVLWQRETSAPIGTPEARALVQKRLAECLAGIADESLRSQYQQDFKVRLDRLFAEHRGADSEDPSPGVDVTDGGLYRGADIGEALAGERIIVVAESEAACDALAAIGLPATTAPGGADGWKTRHSVELRGGDVVVVGGPRSEAAVKALCTALQGHIARLRTVTLPADVEAWAGDGGAADRVYELAARSREWSAEPFKSKFGAVTWGDARTGRETYEYLVKGLIPKREAVLIYGASGSGKSFWTFDLAMAVARAGEASASQPYTYRGCRVRHGLVVYCAAEAGIGFAYVRMPAYAERFGVPIDRRLPFVCLTKKFDLFGSDTQLIELIAEIKYHVSRFDVPLEAIVVDTLNKTTPGMDEIHGKDVGIVMGRLDRLRTEFNCGLWLVHHKNGAGTGPRGHTSLFAAFETAIEINKTGEMVDDGNRKRPIRIAKVIKQREGEDGREFRFVLARQVLQGKDEDGDDRDSCVVLPIGQDDAGDAAAPGPVRFLLKDSEEALFRALKEAIAERGVAPSVQNIPLPKSVTAIVEFREVRARYRDSQLQSDEDPRKAEERARKQIERAGAKLKKFGIIGVHKNWVWWSGKLVRTARGPLAGPGEFEQMRSETSHLSEDDINAMADQN